jgi:peptidoglycan/LPS O-acetylase OafA/YrhL
MMLSVAAFQWESWDLCAFAIALATTFKIYPIALALLLCLLRPRRLGWRIAAWLIAGALLPFALHDPQYVSNQYHAWLQTRLADNRFDYPMKDAPLDLWYLLVRLGDLPVSQRAYTALQVLGGAAIALMVLMRSRWAISTRDILATLYLLVSVWMLLLGPATENQTYVVLAPAACLAAVQSLRNPSTAARILAITAFAILLAAVARNSLLPHLKSPIDMALQPVGALILLAAVLADMHSSLKIEYA